MPFDTDDQLRLLIQNTCRDDQEIKSALAEVDITEAQVLETLMKAKSEIWATISSSLQQYELLTLDLKQIKETYPTIYKYEVGQSVPRQKRPVIFRALTALALSLILCYPILSNLSFGRAINDSLKNIMKSSELILTVDICFFILLSLILYPSLSVPFRNLYRYLDNRKVAAFLAQNAQIVKEFRLKSEAFANLNKEMVTDLKERAIKGKIREIINYRLRPSYSTILPDVNTRGLSEVFDGRNTVDTDAKKHLEFLLETMPGGAIGIAGPRGAGKTTLIRSYCSKERSVDEVKGVKILPVMTSAPVKYDARDFILHLFSITCMAALELDRIENPQLYDAEAIKVVVSRITTFFLRAASTIRYLLVIMISVTILLAAILYNLHNHYFTPKHAPNDVSDTLQAEPHHLQPFLTYYATSISKSNDAPALLITCSVICFLLFTIIIFAQRRALRSQRIRPRYAKIRSDDPSSELRRISIKESAETWVEKIKFQQTYTNGWSGSLKLPIALEGGVSRSTTMAEKPLSYPEIVQGLKDLLVTLSVGYRVIIGIDELDKLESDEDAKNFLNEIKSIFGVPRCFFLISASENAIHYFERRGIPIRDAFDSAFDTMIYVDYFNAQKAQSLLEKRVIGKPVPFFILAYCLAGGLPRDIIRQFRNILKEAGEARELSMILGQLIRGDIRAKARAAHFILKKTDNRPQKDQLLLILEEIGFNDFQEEELVRNIHKLFELYQNAEPPIDDSKDENKIYKNLYPVIEELATYLAWIVTIYQLFLQESTVYRMINNDNSMFDSLAKTRQALAVDFGVARTRIAECRKAEHLAAIPLL
jgi:hypothetical protein